MEVTAFQIAVSYSGSHFLPLAGFLFLGLTTALESNDLYSLSLICFTPYPLDPFSLSEASRKEMKNTLILIVSPRHQQEIGHKKGVPFDTLSSHSELLSDVTTSS